jgi:hypothetical protein
MNPDKKKPRSTSLLGRKNTYSSIEAVLGIIQQLPKTMSEGMQQQLLSVRVKMIAQAMTVYQTY